LVQGVLITTVSQGPWVPFTTQSLLCLELAHILRSKSWGGEDGDRSTVRGANSGPYVVTNELITYLISINSADHGSSKWGSDSASFSKPNLVSANPEPNDPGNRNPDFVSDNEDADNIYP